MRRTARNQLACDAGGGAGGADWAIQLTVKFEMSTTIGAVITFMWWDGSCGGGTVCRCTAETIALCCGGNGCCCWDWWWWWWGKDDCCAFDCCVGCFEVDGWALLVDDGTTVEDVTSSEHTESSLCHLELLCSVVFICAHRSFLHDFDLFWENSDKLICKKNAEYFHYTQTTLQIV